MKTRSTLIALAVAATALTGFAATASQAATVTSRTTIAVGYQDHRDNRPGDSGGWNNDRHDNDSNGGWNNDRRDNDRNGGWDNRGGHHQDNGRGIEMRIQNLQERIHDGRRSGDLSRREASRLESRLYAVISLKRSYERSGRGLNRDEAQTLNTKLDYLSTQVRSNRHDSNRW